ncbi:MAG: 4Fe-4S dicluster domain-containing protein [Thermodesulfobacteriota bacterium]
MKTVRVKNRCGIQFTGAPEARVETPPAPKCVAALPARIPLIKTRLLTNTGDAVQIGTPLFEDKTNPDIKFLSPGGGTIGAIHYGQRRTVREIVIELDSEESHVAFDPIGEAEVRTMDRNLLVDTLMARGVWPLIRDLPYRAIADRNTDPAAIWVPLDSADPFQPLSGLYLKNHGKRFAFGIQVLRRLADTVNVCENTGRPVSDPVVKDHITHRVTGDYPADDPGVVQYHTKQSAGENRAWYIRGQDVLLLAEALATGRYPTNRLVAVSGGPEKNNRHVNTRIGAPVWSLVHDIDAPQNYRWIAGGLFCGYTGPAETFLGFYETALTLIPEARHPELLGFMRPGMQKPTCTRTFLSALRKKPLPTDAGMHGEQRACVNCGNCRLVCPVDIMPQFTYKCIYADEMEEALAHGLLDCVECGLCSYVCPSKIELTQTFQRTKHSYYRERI